MILPIVFPIQIEMRYTPIFASKLSSLIMKSSAICITISAIIVMSNLIDYAINGYNNESSAVVLIHVFSAVFVVFALLCIVGAMKRTLLCLKLGFMMWLILLIIWLTTCCVQFSSWYNVNNLCINNRCAESLWLSDFFYLSFEEVKQHSNSPENTTHTSSNKTLEATPTRLPLKRNYLYITLFVIVFISFLFFLVFLGSMIYSYHDALCYLRDCEEDQSVTVPQGAFLFIYPLRRANEAGPSSGPVAAADDKNKEGTTDKPKSENPESKNPAVKSPQMIGK